MLGIYSNGRSEAVMGKFIKAFLVAGMLLFISLSVSAEWKNLTLQNGYILSYNKLSEYQGLTEFKERFQLSINKNYTIQAQNYLQRAFTQFKGISGIDFSEYYLVTQEQKQVPNLSKPIYGDIPLTTTVFKVINFSTTDKPCGIS